MNFKSLLTENRYILFIIFAIMLSSCTKNDKANDDINNKINKQQGITTKLDSVLSYDIDSIKLECSFFGRKKDNFFVISYKYPYMIINFKYDDKMPKINKSSIINKRFITYINKFFIEEKELIYKSISKRGEVWATDYTSINFVGYKNGKEYIVKPIDKENDLYEVEYNNDFIRFCCFLDSLSVG